MSRHDDNVSLRQMLDHAREAVDMANPRSRADLDGDRLLNLALTRLIEIVGEAANRVSKDAQGKYAQIPWPQIVSMRNRIIHAYDDVDFDVLWDTIELDLPPLIEQLQKIIKE
jgi:uncharacterized protein with HEPN domain